MRFNRKKKLISASLDLTPVIDVVFLLLIFFLLTTSHIIQPAVKVELPSKVYHTEKATSGAVVIAITSDDKIVYAANEITLDELYARLKSLSAKGPYVLVKADKSSSVGTFSSVVDVCRSAGIKNLSYGAVSRKEKGKE